MKGKIIMTKSYLIKYHFVTYNLRYLLIFYFLIIIMFKEMKKRYLKQFNSKEETRKIGSFST